MTTIEATITINRPVQEVFDFVTTPGNWPQWHPSSRAVRGDANHSLLPSEEVTEDFRVAGITGSVVWRVLEREAPRRWVIEGQIVGRTNGGTITYTLTPVGQATHFRRVFVYDTPGIVFKVMNKLVVRRRVQGESDEAVSRLKQVLESQVASKIEL